MISHLQQKEDNVMYWAYGPYHRPLQFQRTLQLHPWQAYPEPFSTPQGVFSLELGLTTGA